MQTIFVASAMRLDYYHGMNDLHTLFGGAAEMSRRLGLPRQTVYSWFRKGRHGPPAWRIPAIVAALDTDEARAQALSIFAGEQSHD